jgi:hypothetical protein
VVPNVYNVYTIAFIDKHVNLFLLAGTPNEQILQNAKESLQNTLLLFPHNPLKRLRRGRGETGRRKRLKISWLHCFHSSISANASYLGY